MTWQLKLLLAAVLLAAGFGSGFGVRAYIAHAEALVVENATLAAKAKASEDYTKALEERDARILELNKSLYQLDVNRRKQLDAKLAENTALRTDLAAERMRFRGAVCPQGPAAGQAASAGVVGDDDGVALTGDARRDVLDLRAAILIDHGIIDYLREYIRQAGLADPGPPVTAQ